jgi:ligand-binding sensor domain-containing protein
MNNINKKNKIFSLSVSSDVPNKNTSEVTIKNNQIIYTSVNNNLQKLVDNDIFIEKELKKEKQYQIGPKPYLENKLSSYVNGYKMWNKNFKSSEPLSILHKINYKLDDSIINTQINSNVNFIVDIGNERLVGTNSGLYALDNDNNITDTIISGKKVISYASKLNDEYIVITTDNGIY